MKTFGEIREELYKALCRWGNTTYGTYPQEDRLCSPGKPNMQSKHFMSRQDEKQATYELLWRKFAPNLPDRERKAAELRYCKALPRRVVADELAMASETVTNYCTDAVSKVAAYIWHHQSGDNKCPHCGMQSLIVEKSPASKWEPEVKCLNCARAFSGEVPVVDMEGGNE